jgi:tetratricopeptide (TPR) repeat protein
MMALENLAYYLVENNRIAEARRYVGEADQLHPPDLYAQTALAHLKILCDQNYEGAIPVFEGASREIGRFPVMHSTQMMAYYIHAVLAEAYFQTRRYREAKTELQALLSLLPSLTARTYYDTTPAAMVAAAIRVHDRLATVLALEGNLQAANAHRQWVLDHAADGAR